MATILGLPVAWAALAAGLLAAVSGPARADEITGTAKAVDADVIAIDGKRIMLLGVESVERKQTCSIDGKPWDCHAAATRQLETLIDQGPVTCVTDRPPDRYGRWLARCTVAGQSLNEAFVRSGFAVARVDETPDYAAAEKAAEAAKAGLWRGKFQKPWDWRVAAGILVDRP